MKVEGADTVIPFSGGDIYDEVFYSFNVTYKNFTEKLKLPLMGYKTLTPYITSKYTNKQLLDADGNVLLSTLENGVEYDLEKEYPNATHLYLWDSSNTSAYFRGNIVLKGKPSTYKEYTGTINLYYPHSIIIPLCGYKKITLSMSSNFGQGFLLNCAGYRLSGVNINSEIDLTKYPNARTLELQTGSNTNTYLTGTYTLSN